MIQKNIALSENYGDMMNFIAAKLAEPITKQYLETCPSNATYTSYTSAESFVDAINFYFESKMLKDIYNVCYRYFLPRAENKNDIFRYCKS